MDKRKNNGGHSTKGKAGRKSKSEEQSLIEKLRPIDPIARRVLQNAVNGGEKWAVELFFKYFYGLPTQVIDQTINSDDNQIEIKIVKTRDATRDTSDK
jgi:hypothetical protein